MLFRKQNRLNFEAYMAVDGKEDPFYRVPMHLVIKEICSVSISIKLLVALYRSIQPTDVVSLHLSLKFKSWQNLSISLGV